MRRQCSPLQVHSSLTGFQSTFLGSFFSERFGILKTACSFQQICYLSSVTVVNVNRSTYNQQNSAECFAPTPTKPKIFSGDMPYRFIIGQYRSRFGNGSKKKQPASAAYKDREIHISLNWRRSSSVLRMLHFSSTYVPHTHKLLADHLQTTIAYQINVVRDFDYFLFEKISVYIASLYVIGYYKVVIV